MNFFKILHYLSGPSLVFWDLFENPQTSSAKPETGPGVRVTEKHTALCRRPNLLAKKKHKQTPHYVKPISAEIDKNHTIAGMAKPQKQTMPNHLQQRLTPDPPKITYMQKTVIPHQNFEDNRKQYMTKGFCCCPRQKDQSK